MVNDDRQPLTTEHTLCPTCNQYTLTKNDHCAECGERKSEAANDATRPPKKKVFLKG